MPYARFVQDWLEGWNTKDLDRIMAHYAVDATFQSPSVIALTPSGDGMLRGRDHIRQLYEQALQRFPTLRFELDDVIERPPAVILIYRKLNVFSDHPGMTVEVFELEQGLVKRNVVYWSTEEVVSRFQLKSR